MYSLSLMRKNLCNKAEEEYLMTHVFPKELVDLYEQGVVYIHDKQLSSYCQSVSCKDVATIGIPTLAQNMIASEPAASLRILLRHFSNIVTLMSQQVSGAVMLSQMTTIAASYLYYENTHGVDYSEHELKKMFKSFIYELNLPLRSGSESAFSNVTLEFGKPSEEIKDELVVVGGEVLDYTYKDIPGEYFDRINKAIIDVMAEGSSTGIPFTFPLITVQIDDDFNYHNKLFLYLLEKIYYFGGCYFENFKTKAFDNEYYRALNPKIKAKDPAVSRSLCCRLQIPLDLLQKVGSGIFGSSVGNTGAVQVLNLNMDRMFLEYGRDYEAMKKRIHEIFWIMEKGHMAKRRWIEAHKELYPTFFSYNSDLRNYFNVFAVTGMHEGLINAGYKKGMIDPEGKMVAHDLMQYMSSVVDEIIEKDKVACGIEYAPAENAGIKLARSDVKWAKEHGREIFVQGKGDDVFLTSGCMVPFSEADFLQQIENAAEFQGYATSGSILHHFLEEVLEPEVLAKYIDKLFEKPINYITITPTLTSCMTCGEKIVATDAKNLDKCPYCGSDDLATFSRVIGYVRMIARKRIHEKEGKYAGEHNFWAAARRIDWASRRKMKEADTEL